MPKKRESEFDQIAGWLERLFRVPGDKDYVVAAATVLEVRPEQASKRYEEGEADVVLEAEGFEATTVTLEFVVRRDYWPIAGQVLPVRALRADPEQAEIIWERVPRRR